MFLQGFVAAVHDGPLSGSLPGADQYERAYAMGKLLSDTVVAALPNAVEFKRFDILHKAAHFSCQAAGAYFVFVWENFDMPKRYVSNGPDDSLIIDNLEVSWHRLGDVEFAAFPGEGTPEYSLRLKDRMVSEGRFVVGLANDAVGYLLDPESLAADTSGQLAGYEAKMGLGAPGGPCCFTAMESLGWFDGAGASR
jgi:hypothetical protein